MWGWRLCVFVAANAAGAGGAAGGGDAGGRGTTSAAEDLQAALSAAIRRGAPSFIIPGGEYRFAAGTSLLVHGAAGLAIRAPLPVQLVFSGSAGLSFVDCAEVSIGNLTIDYDPPPTKKLSSITYALVNCSDVVSEDVVIHSAPYMAVTAFGGGGNHTFRRLRFVPLPGAPLVSQADAVHFSDVRVGPTFEDSSLGHCGDGPAPLSPSSVASRQPPLLLVNSLLLVPLVLMLTAHWVSSLPADFFNIKTNMQLLLQCDSPLSCVIINPHVSGEQPIPFGGSSVLATVRSGDHMSFFAWPGTDMVMPPLTGVADGGGVGVGVEVHSLQEVGPSDPAVGALRAAGTQLETSLKAPCDKNRPWTAWCVATRSSPRRLGCSAACAVLLALTPPLQTQDQPDDGVQHQRALARELHSPWAPGLCLAPADPGRAHAHQRRRDLLRRRAAPAQQLVRDQGAFARAIHLLALLLHAPFPPTPSCCNLLRSPLIARRASSGGSSRRTV